MAEKAFETDLSKYRPTPIDKESHFGIDELFFSTTDRSSHIISGNSVFHRVSQYTYDEMSGQTHNMVRHPDMPRCIFRTFWNHLNDNEPVAAYVKNLTKEGRYYWVFAYIVPVEQEFISVRLRPSSEYFEKAKKLYTELREIELNVESSDLGAVQRDLREQGMQRSTELLQTRLHEYGFRDYDQFMHAALTAEILARDAAMKADHFVPSQRETASSADDYGMQPRDENSSEWTNLATAYEEMRVLLNGYMSRVEYFDQCDRMLSSKSVFLENLAENIRVFSLNSILACDALHDGARTLAAVASLMRDRSNAISGMIASLTTSLHNFSDAIEQIGFHIGSSRLQTDLATQYVNSLIRGNSEEHDLTRNLALLAKSEAAANQPIREWLARLIEYSHEIADQSAQVQRELGVLQVLHMNGRIESASVPNNAAIVELFQTIGEQVRNALAEMEHFSIVQSFFQLEKLARDGMHAKLLDTVLQETRNATHERV